MPKSPEEKAAEKAAKKAAKETTPEEKAADNTDSEDEAGDEEIDDADEETSDEAVLVSVEYINPESGLTVREFSFDVHGKHFKKLATQFAEKFKGTIL